MADVYYNEQNPEECNWQSLQPIASSNTSVQLMFLWFIKPGGFLSCLN